MSAQPAQLVALNDGPNILLDKPILLIGRHQECDIQIPSRKISRRHCCIAQVDDHLVVRDLCSTNGIRINGVRVNEGPLKAGDELTIGNFRYQIHCADQAEVAGAPLAVPVREAPPRASPEDDPFDSCEEPIPLAEPEPSAPRQQASASSQPGKKPSFSPSLAFPENIKLAPLGDSQMPPRK